MSRLLVVLFSSILLHVRMGTKVVDNGMSPEQEFHVIHPASSPLSYRSTITSTVTYD